MNNGVISDTNTRAENSGAKDIIWIRSEKNTKKITEYIQHQLEEDAASDQLTLDISDPFTGSK